LETCKVTAAVNKTKEEAKRFTQLEDIRIFLALEGSSVEEFR